MLYLNISRFFLLSKPTWDWKSDRIRSRWGKLGTESPRRDRDPNSHYKVMSSPSSKAVIKGWSRTGLDWSCYMSSGNFNLLHFLFSKISSHATVIMFLVITFLITNSSITKNIIVWTCTFWDGGSYVNWWSKRMKMKGCLRKNIL